MNSKMQPWRDVLNTHQMALGRNWYTPDTAKLITFDDCARYELHWNDGAMVSEVRDMQEEAIACLARYGFTPTTPEMLAKLPAPSKYRDGTSQNPIHLEIEQLPLLGTARIESVGSENIYIVKARLHYYCKVMATENEIGGCGFQHQRKPPEMLGQFLIINTSGLHYAGRDAGGDRVWSEDRNEAPLYNDELAPEGTAESIPGARIVPAQATTHDVIECGGV